MSSLQILQVTSFVFGAALVLLLVILFRQSEVVVKLKYQIIDLRAERDLLRDHNERLKDQEEGLRGRLERQVELRHQMASVYHREREQEDDYRRMADRAAGAASRPPPVEELTGRDRLMTALAQLKKVTKGNSKKLKPPEPRSRYERLMEDDP